MSRLFRGAYIVWIALRYGMDELLLTSPTRHPLAARGARAGASPARR